MKRVISMVAVVAVFLSVFAVPVYAVDSPENGSFVDTVEIDASVPPVLFRTTRSVSPLAITYGQAVFAGTYATVDTKNWLSNNTDVTIYAGAIALSNGRYSRVLASEGQYYFAATTNSSSTPPTSYDQRTLTYNSDYGFYTLLTSGLYGSDCTLPVFSSEADFYSSVSLLIAQADVVEPQEDYTFLGTYVLRNISSSYVACGWVNGDFVVASFDDGVNVTVVQGVSSQSVTLIQEDSVYGLNYRALSYGSVYPDLEQFGPQFSSLSAFLSSAAVVLSGLNSSVVSSSQFEIPAGYVAYFSLSDLSNDLKIYTTFNNYNNIFGQSGSAWDTNQTFRFGASLPTSGLTYPVSGSSVFRWFKDASGKTDLLGRTKSAVAVLHPTSNMIEIYNPYHVANGESLGWNSGNSEFKTHNSMFFSSAGVTNFRLYPLSDEFSLASDTGVISSSDTGFTDFTDGFINSDTGEVYYQDNHGNYGVPVAGGTNAPVNDESITDILSGFISRFMGLFSAGHNAIRVLSQNASDFMSRLAMLYQWLPPEVLSVLSSAIILVIIIGVLKVFL